jgi:hexosaminidase
MERQLSIIPKPVSVIYKEGEFFSDGIPLISGDSEFIREMETVRGQLLSDFEKPGIISPDKTIFCKKRIKTENDEGYSLLINKDKINIEASTKQGMFNALQVFRQLVLSEYDGRFLTLPCAEITDYPRFPWRGFMLDCSRYFYSVPFIKKLIDVLSLHHINRFHWHLTDDQGWRLPVPEYPLLTEIGSKRKDRRLPEGMNIKGGFYTEDDIRQIVDYASLRHIEVIPEVDLPGHTSSVLASYPGLGCTGGPYRVEDRFGIFKDVLCAGNDQLFDMIAAVFDTLARLFPSKWVHIGGDEVLFNRWKKCPKCQKRKKELGLEKTEELQSWITYKMVQMLEKRGKIAIGWDEVLNDSEKFKLPKETVVMSWQGAEGGTKASNLGHQVIMAPNTEGCYLDHKHLDDPEEPGQVYAGIASVYKSYSMNPVTVQMKKENSHLILGGQCTLFSEYIHAGKMAEYMIFPRLCAISETLWTENKNFEDFSKRLDVHKKRLDLLEINQYRGPLIQKEKS